MTPTEAMRCLLIPFLFGSLATAASAQSDQLVAPGSVWKYLDDGSNQGVAWRAPAFDDSLWAQGPAQLGYGDGDESTVVSFGTNADDKHITTYFRHEFTVADASIYQAMTLRLLRDDGAVVFLNGIEFSRSNIAAGPFNFNTVAQSSVSSSGEDLFYPKDSLPSLLVTGTNVLAVEIHQRSNTSSDISFDAEFVGHQQMILSRGPYLQAGSETSVRVRWRTIPASDSRVYFGLSSNNLSSVASDTNSVIDHEIEITGLTPGTTYYYSIGSSTMVWAGGDDDHSFQTHPPVGSTDPVRIWAVGDSGTADNKARLVRDSYYNYTGTTHTNLWLMLGDNAYVSGSDDEYEAAVFDMYPEMLRKSVLWPTRGNHEMSGPTYYDIFSMPTAAESGGLASGTEAYYSFDYANVHFVCLDSEGSNSNPAGAMMTWVQADLAATNQDWIVAFWHHPPYSKGSHDSDTSTSLTTIRQNLLPTLEAAGVDLVLNGHSHSYERSYLLNGHYGVSGTLTPGMIVDGGSGQVENDGAYNKVTGANSGTVYTVAGSSGKTGDGSLNHPVMFKSTAVLGSVVLDVSDSRLDVSFLRSNGNVADHWTLLRESYTGNYCAVSPTAEFCEVRISASGTPSVSDVNPFLLDGTEVVNNKSGLLFYGFKPTNKPLFGGRLCIGGSVVRTNVQNSGGGPLPCTGAYTFDFNALIQSGADANLVPGATVYAQYCFRDIAGGASLTDGYQFVIQP